MSGLALSPDVLLAEIRLRRRHGTYSPELRDYSLSELVELLDEGMTAGRIPAAWRASP
jgi:hypothetical protein